VSEIQRATIQYPGGLAARYRWGGSASADDVFGLSEQGGELADHGPLVSDEPDRLCRAEMRIEGPLGEWTARFASPIFDEPSALLWDSEALLLVKYGFCAYAIASRTGALSWWYQSGTPLIAVLGSSRLPHVVLQSEVETIALDPDGAVVWRVAHSDVITAVELVGGTLALTSYGGDVSALDPGSGQTLPR
jgi:hypothetical protein